MGSLSRSFNFAVCAATVRNAGEVSDEDSKKDDNDDDDPLEVQLLAVRWLHTSIFPAVQSMLRSVYTCVWALISRMGL